MSRAKQLLTPGRHRLDLHRGASTIGLYLRLWDRPIAHVGFDPVPDTKPPELFAGVNCLADCTGGRTAMWSGRLSLPRIPWQWTRSRKRMWTLWPLVRWAWSLQQRWLHSFSWTARERRGRYIVTQCCGCTTYRELLPRPAVRCGLCHKAVQAYQATQSSDACPESEAL